MINLGKIHEQIKAVCPIESISIGKLADSSTWKIEFDPAATKDQRDQAQALLNAYDPAAEESEKQAKVIAARSTLTQLQNFDIDNATLAELKAYLKLERAAVLKIARVFKDALEGAE
jgi:hypothetical protein